MSRKHLSAVINGHSGITAEMAMRLAKAFGGLPETWLRQQAAYDLWQIAERGEKIAAEVAAAEAAWFAS